MTIFKVLNIWVTWGRMFDYPLLLTEENWFFSIFRMLVGPWKKIQKNLKPLLGNVFWIQGRVKNEQFFKKSKINNFVLIFVANGKLPDSSSLHTF